MAAKQFMNTGARQKKGDNDAINFREILITYSRYWWLFLISVLIAMIIAFIFYKLQKPVYTVKASLEMEDNKDRPSDEKSALQQLDLFSEPKVVENEIEILKSRQLVKRVAEHLQLWISYKSADGFKKDELYHNSPIRFKALRLYDAMSTQKLDVHIIDAKTYSVNQQPGKHQFGETISDSLGIWSISRSLGLSNFIGKTIQVTLNNPEATVTAYQKSLSVALIEKMTSVIEISLNDQVPERGEDFVNNLIYFYNQGEVAQKNNITKSTLSFIDKRLDSLRGELNIAETRVAGYRSGNGITDVNAQSQIYLQDAQANSAKLNDINVQLNVINNLESYVNTPGNSDQNVPSTMGISDPGLVSLVQKLSDLQLKRTEMLGNTPAGNPAFEPINKQIASVKQAIKENIRNIKSNLIAARNQVQSYKAHVQSSIQSVPGHEKQLGNLNRQQSVKENLYTYLLQKREEISLRYASAMHDARMVDMAYTVPPSATKKYTPFAIAFLLGLIFPGGYIYAKDIVKNNITRRRDIEDATEVPLLAEISYVKLPSEIVLNNEKNKFSFTLIEQFRHLRTQLNFLNPEGQKGFVTMITSSLSNEGKSFVSTNLAVSLAKSGKRVILLEMDIYKPKISQMFNLPGSKGLSDYLAGKASRKSVVQQPAGYPELDIIGCGEFIDDFSELLDQNKFKELLEELKPDYDYILVDTPPVHSINDAFIIAASCDVTLFVVRYNHTSKSLLPFIQKLYAGEMLPNMNIVFNGLAEGRDGEGYKYETYYYNKKVPV
ncbi:MAG TPA: polysaccharide biosynthesis tyrosine autokinase [Mucilaginibacter sp.]|jgi:tyrosine-protein kinase Etk/Wzc|nr:polysaccharide biosynthesis tyrosine autokinase [Mucilaginibacter sp.]